MNRCQRQARVAPLLSGRRVDKQTSAADIQQRHFRFALLVPHFDAMSTQDRRLFHLPVDRLVSGGCPTIDASAK